LYTALASSFTREDTLVLRVALLDGGRLAAYFEVDAQAEPSNVVEVSGVGEERYRASSDLQRHLRYLSTGSWGIPGSVT
jgi:hypothetical protein